MTSMIPKGWENVRLGEIGQSLIGLTYSPSSVKPSGSLVLRSSNIQNGRLVFDDCVYVDSPIPEKIRIRKNDILICVRNGSRRLIGKSVVLDDRVVGETFGAFMAVFRSDTNGFLQHFFRSDEFKRQINEHLGATINQITNGSLNSFMVALPGSAEQLEIATRLNDVDRLVVTLEHLITKKQAIKLGMMQQLLTGQTRLPGFSGDWIKKPLKDIVQTPITDGPHLTPKFLPIGVPFLSVNNLVDGKIDWDDVRYISRSDHAEFSKKCAPRRGDILLGKAASVGKVGLVEADIQFNIWSPIAMIRISREHDSRFVHYQLQSTAVENQIALLTNTSSQGNIGMGDIGKLVIGLPPRDEQRAIARCLRDADIEIDAMKKKLNQTRSIKKGMMQELLTGRTRLHVTESAA